MDYRRLRLPEPPMITLVQSLDTPLGCPASWVHFRYQEPLQRYICKSCGRLFNERTGTPSAYIHKPAEQVERVLKMRSEGMGVRATAHVEEISHATVTLWEKRLAQMESNWSPAAPKGSDVTVEGDELYTRVGENRPAGKVFHEKDSYCQARRGGQTCFALGQSTRLPSAL